jgi:hypothetical protein
MDEPTLDPFRDPNDLLAWLLGKGMVLHDHHGALYIASDTRGVGCLYRVGAPPCLCGCCAMSCERAAILLALYEDELRAALAAEPCLALCYDVDTQTWHPEWVCEDAQGRPHLVPSVPDETVSSTP